MARDQGVFGRQSSSRNHEYEPLTTNGGDATPREEEQEESEEYDASAALLEEPSSVEIPFSWLEYGIFVLLGMAMLWAWNMFLAAAPYFASRFSASPGLSDSFQSAILATSTVTNLGVMLLLSRMQSSASYPFRINLALAVNMAVFALLTASTGFLLASPRTYFAFVMATVAGSAWATGLVQNGAFAFAASFGRPEYMQALMAGQGVAGVLPAVAQVVTVLAFPPGEDGGQADGGRSSAFAYFLAAVVISFATLLAFIPLVRRHNRIVESKMAQQLAESMTSIEEAERTARKVVPLMVLLRKLRWLAASVALVFTVTMFYPVFTAKITSVNPPSKGAFFRPEVFIPLAFFCWNLGDLGGRMATVLPYSLNRRPKLLFALTASRVVWIPLYLACNIRGEGAVVPSDFFYLFVVQFLFGLTNGWLSASSMMAAPEWVDDGEKEAAGGFMGLCLVAGLAAGSVLSFTAAGV
ncbi:hypothetical protein N3K66_002677 [Trichothecium roseum]|uniref:Uncharacterized protein n=1 Tax=Trichothecium roseum TaxID=47278 RepID=A0ACC0VA82_9HYPO|nr:hypothetical protein N3K66_002677 [Trichothecium roseum]